VISLFQNESFQHHMADMLHNKYLPAIYTHCYDMSGTRLFAAGGPLQFNLKGNYIALFQWVLMMISHIHWDPGILTSIVIGICPLIRVTIRSEWLICTLIVRMGETNLVSVIGTVPVPSPVSPLHDTPSVLTHLFVLL
jgi:hypothetical protein